MDPERLDSLGRCFAGRPTRRRLVCALAAVGLGTPAAGGNATPRHGRCRAVGRACRRSRDCCSGALCGGRTCACPDGRGRCGNGCVAAGNCAAGNACEPGTSPDTCSGASTCTGAIGGRTVCCGLPNVHRCGGYGDAFCCSGVCGEPDAHGVRRCA